MYGENVNDPTDISSSSPVRVLGMVTHQFGLQAGAGKSRFAVVGMEKHMQVRLIPVAVLTVLPVFTTVSLLLPVCSAYSVLTMAGMFLIYVFWLFVSSAIAGGIRILNK